jgi:hypothetical protein
MHLLPYSCGAPFKLSLDVPIMCDSVRIASGMPHHARKLHSCNVAAGDANLLLRDPAVIPGGFS